MVAIGCFADDDDVARKAERRPRAQEHDRMIICDNHPHSGIGTQVAHIHIETVSNVFRDEDRGYSNCLQGTPAMIKMHAIVRTFAFVALASASHLHAAAEPRAMADDTPVTRAPLPLTPAEQAFIASLPTLRVAYDPNFAPFSHLADDGEAEGLARDYLDEAAGQLGLRLHYVASPLLERTLGLLAHDEADLVLAFNPRGRAGAGLSFTHAYITFPMVIATRADARSVAGIDDLAGGRLAANMDREAVLRLVESATLPPHVQPVTTTESGLALLASGKVDAAVGNLAAVDYLIRSRYPQLRTGAPTGLDEPLAFAVAPRLAPLAPLLDRALARIGNGERQRIANTWLSVHYVDGGWPAALVRKAAPYAITLAPLLVVASYLLWGLTRERRRRRDSEAQLADVTMHLPAVVYRFHVDPTGKVRFRYIGGDAPSIFGLSVASMLADDAVALATMDASDRERLVANMHEAARTLTPLHTTVRVHASGQARWVTSHGIPRRLELGVTEFNGYWIDVTAQRAQADALALAKQAAESATRAKTEFVATMSHEIRTPMNGMMGMLELLDDTPLDEEQRHLLATAGDSAEALLQILNDILDFSKIEAGRLVLAPVPTDLRTVIDAAVAILAHGAHAKGLTVAIRVDAAVAAEVVTDPARLRQVVVNLVSNAIKFTEAGRVTVTVVVTADEGSRQHLRLTVSDTGIGVDAATLATLFTPFTQAEASTSRRFGGTGLGLAISQRLTELMGGSISMASTPGVGSSVAVDLALAVHARAYDASLLRGHAASIRLRNEASSQALGEYLQALGMERAPGAADLVFVDDDAPADAHAIRVTSLPDARGFHRQGDALVATDNPWRWSALARLCEQALGLRNAGEHPRHERRRSLGGEPVATHAGRILVADDHPTNRSLVRAQLQKLGYACDAVDDGDAALAALSSCSYALVLLDCQMPTMDGYTVARRWREREAGGAARLPLVAMTANALGDELARCLAAGMDDLLTKPTNLASLGQALARWLPATGELPGAVAGVDLAPMLASFGGRAVVVAVVSEFLSVAHGDLARLDEHAGAIDIPTLHAFMHRMLGGMVVFGDHAATATGDALLRRMDEMDTVDVLAAFAAWRVALDDFLAGLARWREAGG
jgi:two-component system sensor histidine kinase EvgS